MKAKMDCANGIQECIDTVADLKSNNAEDRYLATLDKKIEKVESRSEIIALYFGFAFFAIPFAVSES